MPPARFAICGAKTPRGACQLPAGWGTDHVGVGACRKHFGNAKNHKRSAGSRISKAVVTNGDGRPPIGGRPIQVHPHNALLYVVWTFAGELAWINSKVEELHQGQELETTMFGQSLNIWIRERDKAAERLARYAKMALDAGVDERRVQVAERQGELLARFAQGMLDRLGLTAAQLERAPEIVHEVLLTLEAPSGVV